MSDYRNTNFMKVLTIGIMAGGMVTSGRMTGLAIAQETCSAPSTQQALNRCAAQSHHQADQNLQDFITTYQTRLRPEQITTLQHTQAFWEWFRRLDCEFEASGVSGGSAYPLIFSRCMTAKATARLIELQELAQCEEGNLSCPAPVRE
jgi:uncharacterized protein YecT (DUF1311 family)